MGPNQRVWTSAGFPLVGMAPGAIMIINLNLKIVVQMSERSLMAELENLKKSETPNLATLYRLAYTGSLSSSNCGDRQLFPNFKLMYQLNGEK